MLRIDVLPLPLLPMSKTFNNNESDLDQIHLFHLLFASLCLTCNQYQYYYDSYCTMMCLVKQTNK